MKAASINSMTLLLNLLGAEANYYLNKTLLYTLGLEESFFITYLLDQFKLFKNEGKLREDLSFYMSNSKISVYTTISEFRITELKKSAVNKGIINIVQEGIPTKSYYYVDFDKLLEIISTNKSFTELAYEYAKIKNGINDSIENIEDIVDLRKHSVKSLRFLCKENKISYTGNDNKETLINKLIEKKNPELFENINTNDYFSTVDDISSTSGQPIQPLWENGNYDVPSGQFFRPLVDSKTVTKQILIKTNTNTCHVRDREIENLFKELEINYTDTNVESTNIILNKLSNDKGLLKEYIVNFYNQVIKNAFNIQNKSAFFSAKLKEPDELLIKKLLSKKNLENEEQKIIEEEAKKEEEERKRIVDTDELIDKFKKLTPEMQEEIVKKAEKNKIRNFPSIAMTLEEVKNVSRNVYYRMLAIDIKEILLEENLI